MTDLHPSAFPALRGVLSGYLHEDFAAEYGTPEAALAAFLEDANEAERDQFNAEARRFLRATASVNFVDVQRLIECLGSRWVPSSRETLERWLNVDDESNPR
jgi:hypothetical protein